MNANMLEGLKKLQEAGYALIAAYEILSDAATSKETPATAPAEPEIKGRLDKGQLSTMKISDLRKLAKEMGLSGAGTLAELVERISAAEVGVPFEAESASDVAVKKPTPKRGKAAKKPEPEPEPDPEPEEDDDEEFEDNVESDVRAAVADMKTEEIADLLVSYNLSASGKREALIARVVSAVQDGTISLEDSDEDEETAQQTEAEDEDKLELEDTEVEDTEERAEALAVAKKQVEAALKDGSLKRKDFVEWLNDYYGTDDKMKSKSDEELVADYLEKSALFIDDDGDEHEEGWYAIKGTPYCCGRPLEEEDGKYVCERCETPYDESDIYGED